MHQESSPVVTNEMLNAVIRSWNQKKLAEFIEIATYAENHGSINHAEWLGFNPRNKSKEVLPLPHFTQLGLLSLTDNKDYQLTMKGSLLLKYVT